jgi:hypothetical protein
MEDNQDEVEDEYYSDDPVVDHKIDWYYKLRSFAPVAILLLVTTIYLPNTVGGKISLNSNASIIEFGQGVSQTVACSGDTNLTLTPRSSFTNGSPGAHYLNSVKVSNIPTSCYGVDFTISAYNDTGSTPLALFNTSSKNAVVYNNNGAFSSGIDSTGMTVESSTGTFTATFTVPVAQSSSVFKLIIQSGLHTPVYSVGDRGPGGGFVYYVSAAPFTSTGSTCNTKCKYLEVAPSTWQSGIVANDLTYQWSSLKTATGQNAVTAGTESGFGNEKFNWKIGQGFYNTSVMKVSGATSAAQDKVLAYAGGSTAGQWFIPSMNELNELCKYARGQTTGDLRVVCNTGGGLKTGIINDLEGFVSNFYGSSSQYSNPASVWTRALANGAESLRAWDATNLYLRPIRAF